MPVKIFFCYAREDETLLNKLKSHLKPLQREGLIEIWHDRDISAGKEWEREINEQLNAAQIILLLVSSDFLNSDYCYGIEMKRAIERHERQEVRVIPVILRHIYWQGMLGKLQALPKDGIPITDPYWHDLDKAFLDVARGIRLAAKELLISLKTKEEWLEEGNKFYDIEHFAEALIAYDHAIRLDPGSSIAYNNKGKTFYNLKRFTEALIAYDRAIHLKPDRIIHAHIRYNKGKAFYYLKRYGEALIEYEYALIFNPNLAEAYDDKGKVLYCLKRYDEALIVYDKAIHLVPNILHTYIDMGHVLRRLKRYKDALIAYDHAIRLDPDNRDAFIGKGSALCGMDSYQEALEAHEQAIRLDPENALAYTGLTSTLRHLQRYNEALTAYNQAIRLEPSNVHAYNGKGHTLYNLKRYVEALGAYKKAIRLDPNNSYPYLGISMVYERLGETELAEKYRKENSSLRFKEMMASHSELSLVSYHYLT